MIEGDERERGRKGRREGKWGGRKEGRGDGGGVQWERDSTEKQRNNANYSMIRP